MKMPEVFGLPGWKPEGGGLYAMAGECRGAVGMRQLSDGQ